MPSRPEDQPLILLVDRRDEQYELYSELLASAGYSVLGAATLAEATKLSRDLRPDLILMSTSVAVSPSHAIGQIRAIDRRVPVLMLMDCGARNWEEPPHDDVAASFREPCSGDELLAGVAASLPPSAARPSQARNR